MIEGTAGKLAFPRLAPAAVRASTSGGELSRFAPFDLTDFLCPTRGPDRAPPYDTRTPGGIKSIHPG